MKVLNKYSKTTFTKFLQELAQEIGLGGIYLKG